MQAHDPVAHPKHYTSHPSGVECIELAEHMGFRLGNAFKYVFRAGKKEATLQDLLKARFYLFRESNYPLRRDYVKANESLLQLMEQVVVNEPNALTAVYFANLFKAKFAVNKEDRAHSRSEALVYLDQMIEAEKAQASILQNTAQI
jgi:hypothetical protein